MFQDLMQEVEQDRQCYELKLKRMVPDLFKAIYLESSKKVHKAVVIGYTSLACDGDPSTHDTRVLNGDFYEDYLSYLDLVGQEGIRDEDELQEVLGYGSNHVFRQNLAEYATKIEEMEYMLNIVYGTDWKMTIQWNSEGIPTIEVEPYEDHY